MFYITRRKACLLSKKIIKSVRTRPGAEHALAMAALAAESAAAARRAISGYTGTNAAARASSHAATTTASGSATGATKQSFATCIAALALGATANGTASH